jgi:cytochrome c-type biogenesis protein CcmH
MGLQSLAIAVAVCFSLGATDASSRFNDLDHRLMCTCSCNELLGECNHVSCPMSGPEQTELSAYIATGLGDKEILASFSKKYGATVLAAPTTEGFDLVAWIAPFAVFGAALLGTVLLIKRWKGLADAESLASVQKPAIDDPADSERRNEVRRETSID